jgi:hypothetical protein
MRKRSSLLLHWSKRKEWGLNYLYSHPPQGSELKDNLTNHKETTRKVLRAEGNPEE